MHASASLLLAIGALVMLALGAAHLVLTFVGDRLHPRDASLRVGLEQTSPRLTGKTTMWKAWVGFNASHSLGAIVFGLVYAYLALARDALLFGSPFLLAVGQSALVGYALLGVRYWFSAPLRGILLANALYLAALVARFTGSA